MPHKAAPFAVTPMRRGGYRAECWSHGCGWWLDTNDEEVALIWLSKHWAGNHRSKRWPQVTRRLARAEG